MSTTVPQTRLRDPAYFVLHLQAAAAIREVGQLGWYDSHFLRRVEVARRYLAKVRPERLPEFVAGLASLGAAPGWREMLVDDVFDDATREEIIAISRSARPDAHAQQARENADFGRDVMWRIPRFVELQEELRPRVEALTGRRLVSSYNFLSRYGASGKCDLHMDDPRAMYTFDYCIEQDAVWPIHVSRPVDWAAGEMPARFDPETVIADAGLDFAEHLMQPGQALLFQGSSQWHYRRPKVAGGFCHLLFFHYYPADAEDLVLPHRWAAHFGIPELEPLCDLFTHPGEDGLA